jgi:hypothetical protein
MFKFIVLSFVASTMFGCASTSSVSALQTQLDAHVATVALDHKAMDEKNASQDAAITELGTRMDRAFVKGAK